MKIISVHENQARSYFFFYLWGYCCRHGENPHFWEDISDLFEFEVGWSKIVAPFTDAMAFVDYNQLNTVLIVEGF